VGSNQTTTAASFLDGRLRRTGGNHWSGRVKIPRWVGHTTAPASLIVSYSNNVKPSNGFGPQQLRARHFPHAVGIVSGVDRTPPVLTHFTVTASSVDVTSQAHRLTVTAKAKDRKSGIARIRVDMHGTGRNSTSHTAARLTRHGNTWTGHATVPRCVADGTWLVEAYVTNHAFAEAVYRSRQRLWHGAHGDVAIRRGREERDLVDVERLCQAAIVDPLPASAADQQHHVRQERRRPRGLLGR
jgi:hypothetical protein